MHTPFDLVPLVHPDQLGSDPVTAVLLHADRILLGTEKGTLLVFDWAEASSSTAPPSATLTSRHDGFTKNNKPIDQLGVIKELNGLVCLSGGDVSLYSLADLSLLSSFSAQTRSTCSLLALSTSLIPPSSSSATPAALPQLHTTLALACRRRLLLLSWTDGTWNPLEEVALPHQIRGMAFVDDAAPANSSSVGEDGAKGARKLVAGFSTGEYGAVSLPAPDASATSKAHPVLSELFAAPFPVAIEGAGASAVGSLGKASVRGGLGALGGLGSAVGLGGLPGALGRKVEKNGVVGVPRRVSGKRAEGRPTRGGGEEKDEGTEWLWGEEWGWDEKEGRDEVLVERENVVLPLTPDGKPRASDSASSQPTSITYPSLVDETVVLPPYILSIVAPSPQSGSSSPTSPSFSLAIHAIDSLAPVQSLPVPPRPVSPPASIAESTTSAAASLAASISISQSKPPPTPLTTARLLTTSSPSPAPSNSSRTSNPPAVLLTASPATGSIATGGGFPTQTLWLVRPLPWADQLTSLVALGRAPAALALLRRTPSPRALAASLPRPLVDRLATLHALDLFRRGRFRAAVDAFISREVSPARVVALYTGEVSGKLEVAEEEKEGLFGGRTADEVRQQAEAAQREVQEREDERARAREARERAEQGSPAAAKGSPARGRKGPLAALGGVREEEDADDAASVRSVGRGLMGKRSWLTERAGLGHGEEAREREAQEAAEAAERAAATAAAQARLTSIDELIRYLTDRRQKYSFALSLLPSSSRPSPASLAVLGRAPAAELLALPNVPLTQLEPEQLARVAQVVDTALFRAYLATKPVMVGPLCRIENWCEVEEVEGLLKEAKKYRELLDLYNGKNMHEKAVTLLRQMSDEEEEDDEKVGPTVRYLQKLGPAHVEVIYEASKWVFQQDKDAGLQIFIADLEEVESLPRPRTMQHLEGIGRDVCIRYLEHVVNELGEQGAEFHEKLIELYLEALQESKSGHNDPSYRKLLDLLESSTSYRADRILGRLPSEDMYEVRAILLGRLGRHEGALQIYVYQLEDHATAEQYCKRVYDTTPSMRSTIFPLLLRLYLRPRASHPLLFAPALALLSAHATRIDPLEAFELLPPLVALGDVKVYLEKTLRGSAMRRREAAVVKAVGKARVEQAEREIVELEERRVKIADGRVCPVCHKRIGNSVIAIHNPHGEVTHYQCREQFQERQKAAGVAM